MESSKGLCQCGCGEMAPIAKQGNSRLGYIKNQPMKYIHGHNFRGRIGPDSARWNGGKTSDRGYVLIWNPYHSKANYYGYVREHILIAEKILRKPLPDNAVVHHVNENKSDNRKENLVICQDENYHRFLHVRLRALKACGHPGWKKCTYCKEYDNPENLYIATRNSPYHQKCKNQYKKQLRVRKKQKGIHDDRRKN